MALYHVILPVTAKTVLTEGKDTAVVAAASAADAKQLMKAYLGLPSDAAWAAATVTALTEDTDLEDWRATVTVKSAAGAVLESVTVTAASGGNFDAIGALLVTALNACTLIAGAAYSTPNLTVAGTADNLGDNTVEVSFLPPATWDGDTIVLASLFGTITHEGASGDALAVVMLDTKLPEILYQLNSGH